MLKTAFAQGRLTKDEFGARIDQAFTSQTYAELTQVADLPAGPVAVRPPRQITRTRPRLSMNAALSAGAFAMLAAIAGMLAVVASRSVMALINVTVVIAMLGVLAFGALMAVAGRGRAR